LMKFLRAWWTHGAVRRPDHDPCRTARACQGSCKPPEGRAATKSLAEHGQTGLRDLHVLGVMASAHADRADDRVTELDREAAPEDHQAVDAADRAPGERRVVLDEVVPRI